MQDKKKLVAISHNENQVFLVKSVTENEYNKLLNNHNKFEAKQEQKENELKREIEQAKSRLGKLESKNLLLAKSIYDNFVDRGLLENDDKFQQMWFDFYFNSCELDLSNAPQEYNVILERLGNI